MIWYTYDRSLINLDKIYRVNLGINTNCIAFCYSPLEWEIIEYISISERDAEFEKITKLLGIED